MKQVEFTDRGESSDFWPELDESGNVQFDMRSGKVIGAIRPIYFVPGQVMRVPDAAAANFVRCNVAKVID